ncbi:type II toxin-antitoxin system HigB family toxin [Chitinophaga sp. XS-30]|uniref:type II toxin-antitoxin system HigB family toxin n=1 Tax=Chitinophaga sp. XS-30 TaxID=2604421 RepID=UPI0011DD3FF4|nr:type II toxin-antitoxin system HigB family toxin [Chitinophaga sp. XS-30]QEH42809.1 type II toxin-antitoxin system HigB family toxin [Chitinophaga sp. XS-30]
MKIHLIKKQTIEEFKRVHPSARAPFRAWLSIIRRAVWQRPEDIIDTFGSADLLGNGSNRVVFDIGGNNYRMICHYVFGEREVHLFICWIGTHAGYTRLCLDNKQYKISVY